MTVPTVPLGEVAELPGGKSAVPTGTGNRPTLTFKGLRPTGELMMSDETSEEDARRGGMVALLPGDTVGTAQGHATGWILKKVGAVTSTTPAAYAASTLQVFRPRPGHVDPRFLYHYLSWSQTHRLVTDIAGPRKSLTARMLRTLPIPLPSTHDQRRIAAILDAADALRAKRRQALAKLDTLTQAIFIDMFGDPVTSERWPRERIGSIAEVVTGNTPPRSKSENYGSHIEWLKSDNIEQSGTITRASESLSRAGRAKGREAPAGASLVVCIAGSPKSIGRVGILDRQAAFNQQINAVIAGGSVLPEFVFHQLKVGQRLVQRASTNSMKGMVSKSALMDVEVMVPPLSEQQAYVENASAVAPTAELLRESAGELDILFASLQQRAFRGEL